MNDRHPDYQIIRMPYDGQLALSAVHALIAGLVMQGLGFTATYDRDSDTMIIRLTGGF